ncbi:MAG: 3-dehydroquinate synthase [Bacteroidota bacterium]|nr:3-dehydroquinate synthase [Bacteroidota bacterium]
MSLQKNFLRTLINNSHIVKVPLGNRSYPIYIGANLLKQIGSLCLTHNVARKIVIITDENVARHYLSLVKSSLEKKKFSVHTIVLPSGERQKSSATAEKIYTKLLEWNIERNSTIIALGGGVVGDLAGFIAATYQRGIGFIQIPTSLLAQVDSSVGGKVGINHPLAKNMIGAFYQPLFVLADTSVLKTLPKRELICGIGEVVKYGIILDKKFFSFIEQNLNKALSRDKKVLSHIIQRSCELKAYVVSRDEKEQNLRAILNFGHTIGHALERAGKFASLKHGEAILYGMIAETNIALESRMVSFADKERIECLIQQIPIPSLSSIRLRNADLFETMRKDKKVKDNSIRMTLPHAIGKISLPLNIDERLIDRALDYVKLYGV